MGRKGKGLGWRSHKGQGTRAQSLSIILCCSASCPVKNSSLLKSELSTDDCHRNEDSNLIQ